jgi:hypothetical protein
MLVALAADGDRQTREQTDDENGEQETAVGHRAASSPTSHRNRSAPGPAAENTHGPP